MLLYYKEISKAKLVRSDVNDRSVAKCGHYKRRLVPSISGHYISKIDMTILLDSANSLQLGKRGCFPSISNGQVCLNLRCLRHGRHADIIKT